jgi:hypothetical protein
LESVLARHLGLEKSQRRFLAVMLEECQPSLDIRSQLQLDMTDDSEYSLNLERLLYELRNPIAEDLS